MKVMGNKYAGPCAYCGEIVDAHAGIAEPTGEIVGTRWANGRRVARVAWRVKHRPTEWAGAPTSGRWVGGCPGEADQLNARMGRTA